MDAVWAGWGHASEKDLLPDTLAQTPTKIAFIGPPGAPMRALGDKIGSTIIAQSAGVSTIGWNGDQLRCDYKKEGCIPKATYDKANVTTVEMCVSECTRVGFPIMIKASEGGGGKGVRKVTCEAEVPGAFRQVQGEVPGSPIFVMKLAPKARHLEVQLLADQHGNAIALNGRDCSVQRRFQKIIEEGPPIACKAETWPAMEKAAVALAREVGYSNAGTVEYLYMYETDTFAFLELNPRLQVEHPVTEMITGVNLPAAQLQVSMGIPLSGNPDIRRLYGQQPFSKDPIDFETAQRNAPDGHCIAVRITAENPDAGFQPTSGTIEELNFRSTPDVWGYFSVDSSGTVHEFADSQFGHLFAHGADRDSARKNMIVALKELSIRGDIRTTTEYIIQMMTSPDFVGNQINTAWLDERLKLGRMTLEAKQSRHAPEMVATVGALVTFVQKISGIYKDFIAMIKRGQSPAHDMIVVEDKVMLIYDDVKYVIKISQAGGESDSTIPIGTHGVFYVKALARDGAELGSYVEAKVRCLSDKGYLIHLGGRSHTAYATQDPSGLRLTLDGQTCIFSKEYDPTRLATDVAGKFVKQLVPESAHVAQGDAFAEIEVMKMFMPVRAPEAGTVHWVLTEGAAMGPGDLMATMDLDHPELVKTAAAFEGDLATLNAGAKALADERAAKETLYPHRLFASAVAKLETVMKGYALPEDQYEKSLEDLGAALSDPLLPVYEVEDALGPLTGRIDGPLHKELTATKDAYKAGCADATSAGGAFSVAIKARLEAHCGTLKAADEAAFRAQCASLFGAAERTAAGGPARSIAVLQRIVALYMATEREFNYDDKPKPYNEVVKDLRKLHKAKPEVVFEHCHSHRALKTKNMLLGEVLSQIRAANQAMAETYTKLPRPPALKRSPSSITELMRVASAQSIDGTSLIRADLNELSGWGHKEYAKVALEARMLLIEQDQPSVSGRKAQVADWLSGCIAVHPAIEGMDDGPRARKMAEFLTLNVPLFDLLPEFLALDSPEATQFAIIELYIRRIYPLHNLRGLRGGKAGNGLSVAFNFFNDFTDSASGLKQSSSVASLADLAGAAGGGGDGKTTRTGVFLKAETFDAFAASLGAALELYPKAAPDARVDNCLHVALFGAGPVAKDDETFVTAAAAFLGGRAAQLKESGITRVTFLAPVDGANAPGIPSIFTFRDSSRVKGFNEDALFRNIEPSFAYHLDILRLRNFDFSLSYSFRSQAGNCQVYKGKPIAAAAAEAKLSPAEAGVDRFFVRSASINQTDDVEAEVSRMFLEALTALNTATSEHCEALGGDLARVTGRPSKSNHVFLNVVANVPPVNPTSLAATVGALMRRHRRQVSALGVAHVEIRFLPSGPGAPYPLRLLASDPTGTGIVVVEPYEEVPSIKASPRVLRSLKSAGSVPGIWDGESVTSPYEVKRKFERERAAAAASSDTLYCYDFLDLFREAVEQAWRDKAVAASEGTAGRARTSSGAGGALLLPAAPVGMPAQVLDAVELVIVPKGTPPPTRKGEGSSWDLKLAEAGGCDLVEAPGRPAGQNDVGMVAWLVTLRTPEYPAGRQMVLIANDITFVQGSFGTREDWVFKTASEFARARGLPRLYLAANSGARIGMAEKLKRAFKIEWNNAAEPTMGYKYLYLTPEDNAAFTASKSVKTTPLVDEATGATRHVITDVIGDGATEPDLGVENLRGSGMIAGETSKAYEDIFTLTVVTGRSVGIGAYLVRLGQRTIQKTEGAPIILTGYQALNKLMGKEIYTTNDQLGGGGLIMYPNGVSHLLADDHLDSVLKAVKWLSYVPSRRGAPLPITAQLKDADSVERLVMFEPSKGAAAPYDDPRYLLDGVGGCGDKDAPLGFFDKGSFTETLNEWAQTVVVGRARLGGIPMGVIVTENRTRTSLTPADPADPSSAEMEVMQAGGVWFPDSAYKTAQAIRDFKGEDLPVMIFANWRGFSGGQRDMFLEVLKFGAMIVDALVASEQPIFVYIPPFAELRGGAWVVVDSTINPNVMEFFAAENSRGGVLEATGAASIKFREKDLVATMRRTDYETMRLVAEHAAAVASGEVAAASAAAAALKARERKLMPIYQQIAVQFADLHDTPGRMEAAGVIKAQVPWKSSRSFFYWRLRRRLAEFQVRRQLVAHDSSLSLMAASAVVEGWFTESEGAGADWGDSRKVLTWFGEKHSLLRTKLEERRAASAATAAKSLALECPEGAAAGIAAAFAEMNEMQREVLRQHLAAIR